MSCLTEWVLEPGCFADGPTRSSPRRHARAGSRCAWRSDPARSLKVKPSVRQRSWASMLDPGSAMKSTMDSQEQEVTSVCVASAALKRLVDGCARSVGLGGAVVREGSEGSCSRPCATSTMIDSWEAGDRGGWVHSTTSVAPRRSRCKSASYRFATAE